jgi:hypothetical protein
MNENHLQVRNPPREHRLLPPSMANPIYSTALSLPKYLTIKGRNYNDQKTAEGRGNVTDVSCDNSLGEEETTRRGEVIDFSSQYN